MSPSQIRVRAPDSDPLGDQEMPVRLQAAKRGGMAGEFPERHSSGAKARSLHRREFVRNFSAACKAPSDSITVIYGILPGLKLRPTHAYTSAKPGCAPWGNTVLNRPSEPSGREARAGGTVA